MIKVTGVKFKASGKTYYFDPGELDLSEGDDVIVETARGVEFGTVSFGVREIGDGDIMSPLKPVLRLAGEEDKKRHIENENKKAKALEQCQQKVDKHKLDMKLVDVEYTFDNSKIIFYFTSDGRVDFRELVKDLAGVFKMRIELRQIGVRDETKMMGGIGNCGRDLCCHSWLPDFEPVSIKMAKVQNLSLNPVKISGVCGRLMCCLQYENDTYCELRKGMPEIGERVSTRDGTAVVFDVNILEDKIKTRIVLEEKNEAAGKPEKLSTEYYIYSKEEIKRSERKKSSQDRPRQKRDRRSDSSDDAIADMTEEELLAKAAMLED